MRHGSLFSGIGGFDLASQWMGWENVFHCEWNDFGKKVLKHYWPNAISYDDITRTDFTIHRGTIDILTGGFPCQPYSVAGKRKGKEDDRHLWPEMLRAIREIQPQWIVGENVGGIVTWSKGLVFEEVQTDLEAEGYEVQAVILPACAVDAPHRRDRIWFIAYSNSYGVHNPTRSEGSIRKQSDKDKTRDRGDLQTDGSGNERVASNTRCNHKRSKEESERSSGDTTGCSNEDNANTPITGLEGVRREEIGFAELRGRRYEIGNWEVFPTQSPVCNGDDGLSSRLDSITFPKWRNESIKAGGNAIVPQVVYQIFKSIESYKYLHPHN